MSEMRVGRSVGAVVGGMLVGAVLSLVVDEVLHLLGVFPPLGEAYFGTGPYVAAVAYRSLFAVVGFTVVARLAPRNPARHVWVAAAVGVVVCLGGVAAALQGHMGPLWYPVALVVTTLPCAALAVRIGRRALSGRSSPVTNAPGDVLARL